MLWALGAIASLVLVAIMIILTVLDMSVALIAAFGIAFSSVAMLTLCIISTDDFIVIPAQKQSAQ